MSSKSFYLKDITALKKKLLDDNTEWLEDFLKSDGLAALVQAINKYENRFKFQKYL